FTSTLGYYAEILGVAGDIAAAHAAIDEALQRCDRNGERWCMAELLRIKGDIVRRQGHAGAQDEAGTYLLQAIDWARGEESLLWELRSALCLAKMRREQGRAAAARQLVLPVYQRFTEGRNRTDLKGAESFLKTVS